MAKTASCNRCRVATFEGRDQFEVRSEVRILDHSQSPLAVKRVEILCRSCAHDLALEWKGSRQQSALFDSMGRSFT